MFHELINKDNPKCLFCNSEIDLEIKSERLANSKYIEYFETLTCCKCKESFHIVFVQDDITQKTHYTTFVFSCNKIWITYHYNIDIFFLWKTPTASPKDIIKIPSFPIDFSDKKKLFDKLKTYILFS
jgi:hypothetical protein